MIQEDMNKKDLGPQLWQEYLKGKLSSAVPSPGAQGPGSVKTGR